MIKVIAVSEKTDVIQKNGDKQKGKDSSIKEKMKASVDDYLHS